MDGRPEDDFDRTLPGAGRPVPGSGPPGGGTAFEETLTHEGALPAFAPAGSVADERAGQQTVDDVRRAQRGEGGALDALFRRYEPFVRRIVRVEASRFVLAHHGPDDLVQDALLAAFRGFERFEIRHDSTFRAWLYVVVVRQILQAHERLVREGRDVRRNVPLEDSPDRSAPGRQLEADVTRPDAGADRNELQRAVDAEIAAFDEPERTLLVLYLFVYAGTREHVPWKEVSPQVGLGPDAARVRCSRALVELQKRLRRRGVFGPDASRG